VMKFIKRTHQQILFGDQIRVDYMGKKFSMRDRHEKYLRSYDWKT
jgi:hypothetical protein